jgi:hypothetical protein
VLADIEMIVREMRQLVLVRLHPNKGVMDNVSRHLRNAGACSAEVAAAEAAAAAVYLHLRALFDDAMPARGPGKVHDEAVRAQRDALDEDAWMGGSEGDADEGPAWMDDAEEVFAPEWAIKVEEEGEAGVPEWA